MSKNIYRNAIQNLLKGSPETSILMSRNLRDETDTEALTILQQKLLSFRIAIKVGNAVNLDENELNIHSTSDTFFRAETHFVRGIILIHKHKALDAIEEFTKAADLYAVSENWEKSLLSKFNCLLSKSSSGLLSEQEELNAIAALSIEAVEHKNTHIQALCQRQKSYLYFQREKYLAALNEIKLALSLLEKDGPISDHHICLVHAADCALEVGNTELARLYLEYLPKEIDSRIDFPLAYVLAKMNKEELDLSLFENINSHWQMRYLKYTKAGSKNQISKPKYYWSQRTGSILTEKKGLVGKIKFRSLEAQLLNALTKAPRTKEMLCEAIWPSYSTTENLDDRFFSLKSRLTQKVGNIIAFDGKTYSLTVELKKTP